MPSDITPLAHYSKLSAFEQQLLQFLSVFYEPAHPTTIVNCLHRLDLKNSRGNRPSPANINHYFSKFEQYGLLGPDKRCPATIVEILSKMAVAAGTFTRYAAVIRAEAPISYYYGKWSTRCWRAVRELRIAIYSENYSLIEESQDFLDSQCRELQMEMPPLVQVMTRPFDRGWLLALPVSFQFYLLHATILEAQNNLRAIPEIVAFLQDPAAFINLSADERLPFQRLLFFQLLQQGDAMAARQLLDQQSAAFQGSGAAGSILFFKGEIDAARQAFQDDLRYLHSIDPSSEPVIFGLGGLLHILCQLHTAANESLAAIADHISRAQTLFHSTPESAAYDYLAILTQARLDPHRPAGEIIISPATGGMAAALGALCHYWLNSALHGDIETAIGWRFQQAEASGYQLLALLYASVLAINQESSNPWQQQASTLRVRTGFVPPLALLAPEEPWKRSLEALIHISSTSPDSEPGEDSTRLAWFVEYTAGTVELSPREQRKTYSTGEWSKGRPISLARLHQGGTLNFLSPQDRRICTTIHKIPSGEAGGFSYQLDMDKALPALIGHPHLFLGPAGVTPVEFIGGEPELLVEEHGDKLHIRFAQAISENRLCIHQDSPSRFRIIRINDRHRRIARITGKNGLVVPRSASQQVLAAIGNISSFMTVHSVIAADPGESHGIRAIPADSTIYMHLQPFGSGFRLEMFVKPFRDGGNYLKPGQGVEHIMAEVNGERLQTRRNLRLEEERAREIEELCPILDLAMDMEQETEREWLLHDPADCLQALEELQQIRDKVVVEWPEGERLAITHQVALEHLNLKIRTNRQSWFALSGELIIDQNRVIDLKELLARMRNTPGRFIELGDGQFLALSQEFRKRLDELSLYAAGDSTSDSDELLLHPLAAVAMEKLANQAITSVDKGWRKHLENMRSAQQYLPELPSTLQADLRDYQREGFNWLARLAHWGVGGCLADDMGLGKTLQSLAIILHLASDGPSLVVTPTSVSTNWQSEVTRFTPTLRVLSLSGKDREQTIGSLGKFDLLITTYTLLQQEEQLLATVNWQTVILDEAQAIKNSATKRSRAAMSLKSRFRLITTGTPIENHLGELWNLFHFINPGLLGSLGSFNERFAMPIERYQDREAKRKLKKLIRPFILRRIKSQVLEELPTRTEVTLEVEMSSEETHFYEALRQHALDVLESNREKNGRQLQILTEIMRLRQACCNPRLIDPNSSIHSAKLDLFATLVTELIESRHKVLVFSQFISHLHIIRDFLDSKDIAYQYLDGSTSSKLRKQRVDAFQAGEGDVFLISLKAGGLGLNLTAADYVIHMDPWWNPAIEDQASDRAHRIGQTRPVTIYRLVCKNTIEEKIVKLHQEKRDLAGSLLEGSEVSARLSSEDLLDLIREV